MGVAALLINAESFLAKRLINAITAEEVPRETATP